MERRTRDQLMGMVMNYRGLTGLDSRDALADMVERGILTRTEGARIHRQVIGERVPGEGRWSVADESGMTEYTDLDDLREQDRVLDRVNASLRSGEAEVLEWHPSGHATQEGENR